MQRSMQNSVKLTDFQLVIHLRRYEQVYIFCIEYFMLCIVFYCKILKSNRRSAKVICRFDRLRTAHTQLETNKPYKYILENLLAAYAFDYIQCMLRVKPGWTSCEDLSTALHVFHICTSQLQRQLCDFSFCMFAGSQMQTYEQYISHGYIQLQLEETDIFCISCQEYLHTCKVTIQT